MYQEKLRWSRELAAKVVRDFDPWAVLVGFTSGGDSNIALKLASMFLPVTAVFTCNTTIASRETLQKCEEVANSYRLPYICRCPPYNGWKEHPHVYTELVKKHGFPGQTKTAHNWMYWYLKDHTISRIISQYRRRKKQRVVLIVSGARSDESVRRMSTTQDVTIKGSTVWLNICNAWTASECATFEATYDLKKNRSKCSTIMGISGECWCGSFAPQGQLEELRFVSPDTYYQIVEIRKWLLTNTSFYWNWDEGPPKRKSSSIVLPALCSPGLIMCSTCINNKNVDNEIDDK